MNRPTSSESARAFIATIAIVIVVLALTLYRLGARDVCSGTEAVEGVFVQQMVEQGRYLFPLANGHTPMYKPPLFHWTATAIDRLIGATKVSASNLRLPSVVYAAAGVALTMLFAFNILRTADGALLAGLTLAGSYQYITQARFGRVDMTLCFFEALGLFSFLWWLGPGRGKESRGGSRAMQFVCAAALGFAVLAKGPVGAALPVAAMAIFVIEERRVGDAIRRLSPLAVLLAVLIGSSWYAACYLGGRHGLLNGQIAGENLGRFFGALGTMPPWYYVVPLLLNSGPLSLLVPIVIVAAFVWRPPIAAVESAQSASDAHKAVRFFAIFWIVTVALFSIAAYKRRAYLLPLWPPAAVMLAWFVKTCAARRGGRILVCIYVVVCIALIVGNGAFLLWREARECRDRSFKAAAEEIGRMVAVDAPLAVYGLEEEELAPLLFYLDRETLERTGDLSDARRRCIVIPAEVWRRSETQARDLQPVLESGRGGGRIALVCPPNVVH